jgi:NADPH-dependent F420 reductase
VDTVPIIGGTGALGFAVGLRLAQAGVPIAIGSRDAGRARQAAARMRDRLPDGNVEGLDNRAAAARGPIVLMCVPFRAQSETLSNLTSALRPGQTIVDATVPLAADVGGKATRLLGLPQGSAAQQAQEMVPEGVTVVSALHTLSAPVLGDLERDLQEDVLIAGDSKQAKRRVAELVELVRGLRPVNCGRLETARYIEGLTPLLISVNINNKTHAGIRITGLTEPHW